MEDRKLRILFTSAGRRVSLLQEFGRAAREMDIGLDIHAGDAGATAPALQVADRSFLLPRIDSDSYIDVLLDYCRSESIDALFPLLDPELPLLAEARGKFAEIGTTVVISSPQVMDTAIDKLRTATFLEENGFRTPKVFADRDLDSPTFPLLTKPRRGSASVGVHRIQTARELAFYRSDGVDRLFQECMDGQEYTLDILAGLDGQPLCAVPRLRLETRAGEISKGCTVRNQRLIDEGLRVVAALQECTGMVSVQCFLTGQDEIAIIEINPRFGGGIPLSIRAGADFPMWLMEMLLSRESTIDPAGWTDGLYMLRYDQGIFVYGKGLPNT